ncbi:MAG TPA: dienelactone hydrolase family protein [Allosphingosinicella sp.]|nr:dienelactone hydrolase family protein [Allosphingosinicella sp.]
MKVLRTAAMAACLWMPVGAVGAQSPSVGPAPASVTLQQLATGAPDEQMVLLVWQPAVTAGDTGADASEGRRSLVIISHGTGASPMAHIDTAEALAAAGFVVVAPMHRGDNFQDDSNVGRPQWMARRSRDVSDAIDFMAQEWAGRTHLDVDRVGIFGFSAGATTALVASGGVPDLRRVASHCATQREFVCTILPPQPDSAGSQPQPWVHDPRIAAAVVAAPGLGFAFEPAGLANVQVPVQLWAGSQDDTVPYESNAGVVRRLLPQAPDFHSVEGAAHLSFLAPCTPETPPPLCRDPEGFDRAAFHEQLNRSVTAFFREHLRGASGQ